MTDEIEALKETIIDRLGRGVPERDLLPELCQRYNLDWDTARALVAQVREEHSERIAEHQLPWRIVLAVIGGVGGLALLVNGVMILSEVVGQGQRLLRSAQYAPVDQVNTSLLAAIHQAAVSDLPTILGLVFFGTAMLIGSLLGLRETWRVMINWLAERFWG